MDRGYFREAGGGFVYSETVDIMETNIGRMLKKIRPVRFSESMSFYVGFCF